MDHPAMLMHNRSTYINPHGVCNTVHIDERLSGVHLAEEAVDDGLGTNNVAILVELDAADEVCEVFLHQEEATGMNRTYCNFKK